jgi:hypothetical protein
MERLSVLSRLICPSAWPLLQGFAVASLTASRSRASVLANCCIERSLDRLASCPAIAGRFHELTRRRYETVQLTAQLGTDGIIVSGAVRPLDQISVGTREQLSTLYRLSLAEYLRSTIVLDDQLVQSDAERMEWFRALLVEKAPSLQILVFTCRPTDYLGSVALVHDGNAAHVDYDRGLIRCIDLRRVLRPR